MMTYENVKKRKRIACALVVLMCISFIIAVFQTVFADGPTVDPAYSIVEGSIVSADGVALCTCEENKNRGTVTKPQIYGFLGHNDKDFGRSGLRQRYQNELYAKNGRQSKGNDLILTLNSAVQEYAYQTMLPFSKQGDNTDACAVVLENATGRVLSLVSIKAPLRTETGATIEYDVNNVGSFYQSVAENAVELPSGYYLSEWGCPSTPGSVFKVVSSIPIIENKLQNEKINDTGSITIQNTRIQNFHGAEYGSIDLQQALVASSNVYFASMYAGKTLSAADLHQVCDRALLGQTIRLDFATLNSAADVSSQRSAVMTSFGQVTAVSPVHLCALISGICSGTGTVQTPYLVDEIRSPKGKTVSKTEPSVLTALTAPATAKTLCGDLQAVAKSYGYNSGVYMKTGTAEIEDGVMCYCFCANKNYTVLLRVKNLQKSVLLCAPSYNILRYTTSTMLNGDDAQDAYETPIEEEKETLWSWLQGLFKHDEQTPEKHEEDGGFFATLVRFFKT